MDKELFLFWMNAQMKEKNITQKELADELNVKQPYLSQIKSGKSKLTKVMQYAIRYALTRKESSDAVS